MAWKISIFISFEIVAKNAVKKSTRIGSFQSTDKTFFRKKSIFHKEGKCTGVIAFKLWHAQNQRRTVKLFCCLFWNFVFYVSALVHWLEVFKAFAERYVIFKIFINLLPQGVKVGYIPVCFKKLCGQFNKGVLFTLDLVEFGNFCCCFKQREKLFWNSVCYFWWAKAFSVPVAYGRKKERRTREGTRRWRRKEGRKEERKKEKAKIKQRP